MNARERLQGVNRTLDALGPVRSQLERMRVEKKAVNTWHNEALSQLDYFEEGLKKWADEERTRLS